MTNKNDPFGGLTEREIRDLRSRPSPHSMTDQQILTEIDRLKLSLVPWQNSTGRGASPSEQAMLLRHAALREELDKRTRDRTFRS